MASDSIDGAARFSKKSRPPTQKASAFFAALREYCAVVGTFGKSGPCRAGLEIRGRAAAVPGLRHRQTRVGSRGWCDGGGDAYDQQQELLLLVAARLAPVPDGRPRIQRKAHAERRSLDAGGAPAAFPVVPRA